MRKEDLHIEQYIDWVRLAYEGEKDVQEQLDTLNTWANEAVLKWYPDSKHRGIHFGKLCIQPGLLVKMPMTTSLTFSMIPTLPQLPKPLLIWLDPSRSSDALEIIWLP